MTADDLEAAVAGWEPPVTTLVDPMEAGPARGLAAALDLSAPESVLPVLWHWVYFTEWPAQSGLGPDGHPRDGAQYPPLPERTRMFAGGRLEVTGPLVLGTPAERRSEVVRRQVKVGRSGPMLFVTVRHQIAQEGVVVLVDDQDLMYRSGPVASDRLSAAAGDVTDQSPATVPDGTDRSEAAWQETFVADPVLLFRFSALTANSHRIHYDHPYVTEEEGYPGLVLHGPLLILALVEMARRWAPERRPVALRYRLARPTFAGELVRLSGRPRDERVALAASDEQGRTAAEATVEWAVP